MVESIRIFENSLRDYLINMESDSYNTKDKVLQRYNNLKVYMDPENESVPHFFVSLNISAACFKIDSCARINGSVGNEERLIVMWACRPNIKGELKRHWNYITKTRNNTENMKNFDLRGASEYILGTGIKKSDGDDC